MELMVEDFSFMICYPLYDCLVHPILDKLLKNHRCTCFMSTRFTSSVFQKYGLQNRSVFSTLCTSTRKEQIRYQTFCNNYTLPLYF